MKELFGPDCVVDLKFSIFESDGNLDLAIEYAKQMGMLDKVGVYQAVQRILASSSQIT